VSDRWPDAPELDDPPSEDDENVADGADAASEPQDEVAEPELVAQSNLRASEHAEGEFSVPDGYGVLQGSPQGGRRAVGIVVSRFNGAVTGKLLEGALAELEDAGVARDAITVMPVPGAFELPIAAMALAKTRRYACIVALGCVIKGDTPHFDYVAGEAASGLQLAALETGVPVAFGVLTLQEAGQADDRLEKGREAVQTGLEMADVFAQLRAAAQR
jgi:6,7-dimethyl-8-ribityllumazine synthase